MGTSSFDSVLIEVETEINRIRKRIEDYKYYAKLGEVSRTDPSKHRAALKRSSMDLTRLLTRLRRSPVI